MSRARLKVSVPAWSTVSGPKPCKTGAATLLHVRSTWWMPQIPYKRDQRPDGLSTRGKESPMLTTFQGLPAAANVQQAILFAQMQLLRQLEAQGRQR